MDLMALEEEPSPSAGQELGIHVLGQLGETTKVIPSTVEPLHRTYFRDGQVRGDPISWEVSSSPLGAGSRILVASEICQQLLCQPGCGGLLGLVLGGDFPHGSPSLQVCEPLPSLPEVRTHAQVSLSLLSPAHRRLHEPQPYPVYTQPFPHPTGTHLGMPLDLVARAKPPWGCSLTPLVPIPRWQ